MSKLFAINCKNIFKNILRALLIFLKDIHPLLFTSGQVDIEKVLCLHLLAAHKTETLKTPPRIDVTTTTAKEQSPVERLIERSKRKHAETMTKLLPTYVLGRP